MLKSCYPLSMVCRLPWRLSTRLFFCRHWSSKATVAQHVIDGLSTTFPHTRPGWICPLFLGVISPLRITCQHFKAGYYD